jgi:hypothetical protein
MTMLDELYKVSFSLRSILLFIIIVTFVTIRLTAQKEVETAKVLN